LQRIVDWLVYSVLKFDPASPSAQVLDFFIYDSVKIILLLFLLISVMGFLRSFVSEQKIKGWIVRRKGLGYFYAALFGAATPFCSCSSIPIFISFLVAGAPLGVTISFLVTSPLVNEYLVVLMFGFFGWKITLAYVASGIAIGIAAGMILGRMNLERYLEKDIVRPDEGIACEPKFHRISSRVRFGVNEALSIINRLWAWVLIGVGLGALIHNYVPDTLIQSITGKTGIFSVPIAVLLGVPMYGSCAAIVPIAVALFQKGFPLGTALAFMMAVAALSLPEAVLLKRAMKLRLIVIFFAITAVGIIFTGYLFNLLQKILV